MDCFFENERPIYVQIIEKIRIEIVSGKLKRGEKIPSVRDLAIALKVNPNTIQKALEKLEDEKLIYTERTNGKFVTTDDKLIKKVQEESAKMRTRNYINNMSSLGINFENTLKYLKEMGDKKWN